ncbi:MAG: hypothetical protein IKI31_06000, partial [Treponema sp.]|nr:hypothetical protein [Treponema sp.]
MKSNSVSKIKALVLFTMLFTSFLYAQVNEPEIKSVGDETVEFINYTGPHTRIDSLAAIKEIGAGLGRTIARSKNIYTNTGDRGKYYVIHAVDPTEKGKLDADILFIGANATVDHITNLRRIISAYLSTAYGYSTRDADTLAVFVTVYNAVYRNNIEAFRAKYKSVVMQNLTQEHCGLSIRYSDWPGKSQIVIPLYD